MELVEMMFEEMSEALGYEGWWESEGEWEGMKELMIANGLNKNIVRKFFAEMGEEL